MHSTHRYPAPSATDAELEAALSEARADHNRLAWRRLAVEARWDAYERGVLGLPEDPATWHARLEGFRIALDLFAADEPLVTDDREWLG